MSMKKLLGEVDALRKEYTEMSTRYKNEINNVRTGEEREKLIGTLLFEMLVYEALVNFCVAFPKMLCGSEESDRIASALHVLNVEIETCRKILLASERLWNSKLTCFSLYGGKENVWLGMKKADAMIALCKKLKLCIKECTPQPEGTLP